MKSLPGTGVKFWSISPEKEIGDPAGPLRLLLNKKKVKICLPQPPANQRSRIIILNELPQS